MSKTNEDRLEDLRKNTSIVQMAVKTDDDLLIGEIYDELLAICNDFIQLDISLLEGGTLPGAWGGQKMSKSNMS